MRLQVQEHASASVEVKLFFVPKDYLVNAGTFAERITEMGKKSMCSTITLVKSPMGA